MCSRGCGASGWRRAARCEEMCARAYTQRQLGSCRPLAAAGAGAVILGGAALAGLASRLTAPVRFVDCIDAALTQAMEASAPPSRTLR